MSNFNTERERWDSFLDNHSLTMKEAAEMMGYNDYKSLSRIISNAKQGSRNFPANLTRLMNFVDALLKKK